MTRLRAFAHFWYDFVVGDDWRIALGVITALGFTYLLSRTSVPAWWPVPLAVGVLLTVSVRRETRRH